MSMWAWYQPMWDKMKKHLLECHQDQWQYNDDELRMFEEEFVYGEFKNEDAHTCSCPWADCDWKLEFTTFVRAEVKK